MPDRSQDILRLTEALYRAEVAALQALNVEETRLRGQLRELDELRRAAQGRAEEPRLGYRGIGADMLWQGWIGRAKAELHASLARVLGRKGQAEQRLRRSFGKYEAARRLAAVARQDRVRHRAEAEARRLSELGRMVARHDH